MPRAGKSAGTWEPSSQKEIYLKENFLDWEQYLVVKRQFSLVSLVFFFLFVKNLL